MAFKEIESKFGPSWPGKEPQEGTCAVGVVKERIPGDFNKNNYILGDATIDAVKVEGGELTVWGSAYLCSKMDSVPIGARVRVTFLGTELPKIKGQNPGKLFKVEVDE